MILIKEVKTRCEIKKFTEFPNKLFKKIKAFTPALSMDERNVFNKKKNPAHEYVDSIRFLAYKDNKLVGRIAGIVNHKLNYELGKKQVRFTRLDMIDDINVTTALINAVVTWGKENFITNEIIGPIGFTDLDRQGMLIDGFEELNLFITIYNEPYYKDHMEKLGFLKDVDWIETRISWPPIVPDKLAKATDLIKKRYGFYLHKPKSKKEIPGLIYEVFDIYNIAFKSLYGFYPITRKVIDYYVKQVISLVQLDWIWLVYDSKNEIAGFGVAMPSLGLANKKNNGKLFPFGWLRILKALKKNNSIDFYFIAVKPEHQGKGLPALIFEDGIKVGVKHNIKWAETGPELEKNFAILSFWQGFDHKHHRRRRCWIKEI